MRKTLTAGAFGGVFFALITGTLYFPQQDQIKQGFVDSQSIIGNYSGTAQAQATFNTENLEWQRQAQAIQNSTALNSTQRQAELTDFSEEVWGEFGRAYRRNEELMKPIIDKINALIDRVAQEEGYDYILDTASGGIAWADQKYDLTSKISEMLEVMSPSEKR